MATVSGTFTATGVSSSLQVPAQFENVTLTLTNTWAGTIQLERALTPDEGAWEVVLVPYTANAVVLYQTKGKNDVFRVRCSAYTSGTVTYDLTDEVKVVERFTDDEGNTTLTFTQAGARFPNTLTVDGATTLTGAVTLTGTTTQTGAIAVDDTTASTTGTTGSVQTDGGIGAALDIVTDETFKPLGDTAASDVAAVGYAAADGLVLTGQGATSDITLRNDADGAALTVPTGTTNVDIVGDVTAASINADGDTAAADLAAMGYTSTEGAILTGQGSTNDITLKNDADTEVLGVLTGTTRIVHAGVIEPSRTQAVSNGALESGVTAVYYGDGLTTTAVLTLTNVVLTVGDNATLSSGVLIFTLPAGNLTVTDAAMTVAISGIDDSDAVPDVGIGTVVGVGAVSVLGGTSTFENIIFGTAAADCNGTATVASGRDPANFGTGFNVLSGAAHTVYWNQAGVYSDETDFVGVINGTVVLTYRYNFA